jgi:hypothetical protein
VNDKTAFHARIILYLGIEFLLIQGGMTLNLYASMHNIGGLEMISWFGITGSLAAAVGFGAILVEARPEIPPGTDPGFLFRIAPQLPWIFAFALLFGESLIYFPKL